MDFKALIKQAQADKEKDQSGNSLFCCVLGPSGAGKSHVIGTLGVKTLFLHFVGEAHGVKSSVKEGGENIVPVCLDYVDGKMLEPDQVLARLRDILSAPQDIKAAGFKAIVLDGLTELDMAVSESKELKKMCLTAAGKVDGFKTTPATKQIMSGIINTFQTVRATIGCHFITTCILTVKEYDDEKAILECSPQLGTFGLAESVLQKFGDRVVVSPLKRVNPKTGEDEEVHVFDSRVTASRSSKDQNGNVKKTINFNSRIESGNLPSLMKADLSDLLKVKAGGEG